MKILQVTPRYPPQVGGVENHVAAISTRLVDRGHDLTVVTADAGMAGKRRETRDGVSVRRYRGFAPGGAYHVAPTLLFAVRRIDADVIHAHNYHSLPLLFAAAGVGNRPFLATPHYHGESAIAFRNLLHAGYRIPGRWALRRADSVIAVSEWERDRLRTDFGVEATTIRNGIEVDRFDEAKPCERGRPYLLTVGRLDEYKGVQHVIRALPDLEYDLLVAGDGPYRDTLEREAREVGVADRVSFLGYVSDEELPGLYAGAEVFVTMSSFESFGLTVGEALAAGTPCVVRPNGGLAEWTNRQDCVAADPHEIRSAVRQAVGVTAATESLPKWTDAIDELESQYESVKEI